MAGGRRGSVVAVREVRLASAAANAVLTERTAPADSSRILVGLLGRGIQQSRTPAMHEAEGRANGIAYIYRLLDSDRMGATPPPLAELVDFAEHFGFDGFNVTFPYKQEVIPLLDALSEEAEAIGSVNTVVLRDGRRVGHNTDMWGFKESFRIAVALAPRNRVVMLGAGGAGAAVGYALLESGVGKLMVADIDAARSSALVERLSSRFGSDRVEAVADLDEASRRADGIVNATPVGMAKLPGMPIDAALLRRGCWVADIVYFPLETELLAQARRSGCRTLNGEGMAIFQAVRAFELFTGITPDEDRMKAAFLAFDDVPAD
jgi:shikimate dehydrogenase